MWSSAAALCVLLRTIFFKRFSLFQFKCCAGLTGLDALEMQSVDLVLESQVVCFGDLWGFVLD